MQTKMKLHLFVRTILILTCFLTSCICIHATPITTEIYTNNNNKAMDQSSRMGYHSKLTEQDSSYRRTLRRGQKYRIPKLLSGDLHPAPILSPLPLISTSDSTTAHNMDTSMNNDCLEEESQMIIELWSDQNGHETSWQLSDTSTGGILMSERILKPFQLYAIKKCLSKGRCYKFRIEDVAGDGICCDHGKGSYRIYTDAELQGSGGEFKNADAKVFCI